MVVHYRTHTIDNRETFWIAGNKPEYLKVLIEAQEHANSTDTPNCVMFHAELIS